MTKTSKCIEFYLDPTEYNDEEILKNINNARQEFPEKDSKVKIEMNDWGMYRIKIEFFDKNNYLNNLKQKIKEKNKTKGRYPNTGFGENTVRKYGTYKDSGILYKPY